MISINMFLKNAGFSEQNVCNHNSPLVSQCRKFRGGVFTTFHTQRKPQAQMFAYEKFRYMEKIYHTKNFEPMITFFFREHKG